ncbi:MAG: AAA family ATPase, partial [Oliverpabstia sp.]|nr:AAA family ATPase [Oliverpabstia sp.]
MKYLYFPVGTSNFEKIRSQGYYYVDKTGMIKEILTERTPMVMLITRPRRFGKTLG